MRTTTLTQLLMVDSGAYTYWKKGIEIDLRDYLSFCHEYPDVTYFVSLDVIPGTYRLRATLTKDNIERACRQSWKNYREMITELPADKVIPVFHQHEDERWLTKYLDSGVKYIGISPASDCTTVEQLRWLESIEHHLIDRAGRPMAQTHCFGATNFDVLNYSQFYSADSASWKLSASYGEIYVPAFDGHAFDYSKRPVTLPVTPRSRKRRFHIDTIPRFARDTVLHYLTSCGIELGTYKIINVAENYTLQEGEDWVSQKKGRVVRYKTKGVATAFEECAKINAHFVKEANAVLPIDHIYFAGSPMNYPLEYELAKRLLSYYDLKSRSYDRCLQEHLRLISFPQLHSV